MGLLDPIAYDRGEPLFSEANVNKIVATMIKDENYFSKRVKRVKNDLERATDLCEEMSKNLSVAIGRLTEAEMAVTESAKKVTGRIRATADNLASGLSKVEKTANFDRLERYVELLERAEKAMSALAALEANGKLEKIAEALK